MKLAAAYVRGASLRAAPGAALPAALADTPLEALTQEELTQLYAIGKAAGLKMHYFKEKDILPRVRAVLGFLRGVQPASLLDVGSGRGVFLFPFLEEFPDVGVTSLDLLPHRVQLLQDLTAGGVTQLTALQQDLCRWDAPEGSFDVVTLLEVLEHIPDVGQAIRAAVRLARRYVVVTVPSKPDNNPEHIHLLTKATLTELFQAAGCTKLSFSGVLGHLVLVATIERN